MVSEKKLFTELINLYQTFSCLWDNRTIQYLSKKSRDKAYEALLEKYREIQENATMSDLKRKIEHLRAAYRREHKKVLLSGNKYTPTLWYYELLNAFLGDVCDFSSVESDNNSESHTNDPKRENVKSHPRSKRRKTHGKTMSAVYLPEPQDNPSQSSDDQREDLGYDHKDDDEEENIQNRMDYFSETEVPIKQEIIADKDDFTNSNTFPRYSNNISELESFGVTIGLQLRDLEPMQKAIAQKLISDVIFDARLRRLTVDSTIVHRNP